MQLEFCLERKEFTLSSCDRRGAFTQIRSAVVNLIAKYTTDGFCEETEGLLALYKGLIEQFEEEYEL